MIKIYNRREEKEHMIKLIRGGCYYMGGALV